MSGGRIVPHVACLPVLLLTTTGRRTGRRRTVPLGYFEDGSTPVLIAILTDGAENSSQATTQDVFSVITYRRTTYRWNFVFIGPPEAESYALQIGIPKSNFVRFSADPAGIHFIIKRLSKSMRAYQLGDRRYALKLHNP